MEERRMVSSGFKLGILGGGQLGKMLSHVTSKWDVHTSILESSSDCPAADACNQLVEGDFLDYNTVMEFGKSVDVLTIELENVNADALKDLEELGKEVYPEPTALITIQDKGTQKKHFQDHNIATSDFKFFGTSEEIKVAVEAGEITFPFVQKARRGGYDGKGVSVIKSEEKLDQLLDTASIVEDMVEIEKELSVVVARGLNGETKAFPVVEMVFNHEANLVDYLICPSAITDQQEEDARALAIKTIESLDMHGLLAVEMFLTKGGEILVNEVAPRPHNSGHHTIEACYSSQYEQHLRAILGLPLGSTDIIQPAVMVNLLGEPEYTGDVVYEGLKETMAIPGVNLHIYGKKTTKPFRKMGHATILAPDTDTALSNARKVQTTLKIKA